MATEVGIGFGKANYPRQGMTIAVFGVAAPFVRTLATKSLGMPVRSKTPCGGHDNDGMICYGNASVPDGTILLLQARQTVTGRVMADAGVFIRVREQGAFLSVQCIMPRCPQNTIGNFVSVFEGRGDILSAKQVRELGIDLPNSYVRTYMNVDEIEECFSIEELSPQMSAPPVMEIHTNAAGETVVIPSHAPARRMRVRRT